MKRSPIRRRNPNLIPAATRIAVERRDMVCQALRVWDHVCWGGSVLHHRLPRSRGGEHTVDNLVRLCSKSHAYIHEHPAWAKGHGFLL